MTEEHKKYSFSKRPFSLAPLTQLTPPVLTLPKGACDTHTHIFGKYPFIKDRDYEPFPVSDKNFKIMLKQLGFERGVLVQPSVYGCDNRAIIDALANNSDHLRGVITIDTSISDKTLEELHDAGVRGFRINPSFNGGSRLDSIKALADKTRAFGWHCELLLDVTHLPHYYSLLSHSNISVVFANMGYFSASKGTNFYGFNEMIKMAKDGQAWVKISGPYWMSDSNQNRELVKPVMQTLIEQIPERLLWGSDWPHVSVFDYMVDTGILLQEFLDCCPDEQTVKQILVDNPAKLYGFDDN